MAVAAETITQNYQLIDDNPDAALLRQEVRSYASQLVQERVKQQQVGGEIALPLDVDALSTAEYVLETSEIYGLGSGQHKEAYKGLLQDCSRLVGEWYRKLRPEYFEPIRHVFDHESGDFFSHGLSIRQMTENALRPIDDDPEEVTRRINERVEDATPQIIRKLGGFALDKVGIRTISECSDKAIQDYQQDMANGRPHSGYRGYVPEIEKVMVRDIRFADDSDDRLEEQIGLPGTYITHDIIQRALLKHGVDARSMNKTELHSTQLMVEDSLMEFVQLLDAVASEEWCTPIFMGEAVSDDYQKDYANFRAEAKQRQVDLKDHVETVATFVLDLAADNVDKRQAPLLVEEFVKKILLNMAKVRPELANTMFDAKTAAGLQEVAYLESIGQHEAAFARMNEVESAAPGGGYCTGGSCGLENVNLLSEAGKTLAEKLKAKPGDSVVADKIRSCKCGKKGTIVYAYNSGKVNKYCQSCTGFESKTSKVAA